MRKVVEIQTERERYTGRFIGFIKEDELNKLLSNVRIIRKISASSAKDLTIACDIVNRHNWGLEGIRFVAVVNMKNNKELSNKKLFVSEKLNFISMLDPRTGEVHFVTNKGHHLIVKESII